jgi:hypothetical protein
MTQNRSTLTDFFLLLVGSDDSPGLFLIAPGRVFRAARPMHYFLDPETFAVLL